jgi:hypothetical protein
MDLFLVSKFESIKLNLDIILIVARSVQLHTQVLVLEV